MLAQEAPVDADMVIPVPDSGVPAALGFANAAKIPFELGIIRNHYVGRTFIEPSDSIRHLGVRLKHNPNRAMLKGKRVVLVDDSIVRGTTSKKIVAMVRDAGAAEVHFRVSSPPTTHSCFYGVDTPNTDELLAHKMDVEQMRRFIGADSLAFISMNGLYRAMGQAERVAAAPKFCDACFTGDYPIALTDISGGTRQLVAAGGRRLAVMASQCGQVNPRRSLTLAFLSLSIRCGNWMARIAGHDRLACSDLRRSLSPAPRAASAAPPPSRWPRPAPM